MIEDLKNELENQGHIMTGRMRDSIELLNIGLSSGKIEAFVGLEDYYSVLDTGIKAGRIPFNPGSGKKSSKYIEGLINFWMIKKGLNEKEATRAAFALAHKHKKEGMPTQSSWRYSPSGRRLEFFTRTLDSNSNYDDFEENLENELEKLSIEILNQFEKQF